MKRRRCGNHHRLKVRPLTPDDTGEYLRMLMTRAGYTREVFASDAAPSFHDRRCAMS